MAPRAEISFFSLGVPIGIVGWFRPGQPIAGRSRSPGSSDHREEGGATHLGPLLCPRS
jgi:hypothetical protein